MTYFWHRLLRDHKWKYSCMYNGIAYFDCEVCGDIKKEIQY